MRIVGRKREQEELKRHFESGRPEFLVVTGRRRVGKTFLVREMFSDNMSFYFSGMIGKEVSNNYSLRRFDEAIVDYGGKLESASQNWSDAFRKLRKLLEASQTKRQVVFIDELPWLDAPKSDFLTALDNFWNTFASARTDIMLITCGSSASWMIKNIFQNRGGLHNRVTGRISLAPFTLGECEAFFDEYGIVMSRYQIAEIYMVFGGIPYYLSMIDKSLGPSQNIDRLLFASGAPLKNEFGEMYNSLFSAANRHIDIVRALSKTKGGLTRSEIIESAKIPGGGNLTKTLNELEQCGFIEKYADFTKKRNSAYYRLVDSFSLFWLKYVENNNSKDEYYWTNLLDDGGRRAWSGNAFEQLCLLHVPQIKHKLGISGISSDAFKWRSKDSNPGTQIDLLISRRDGVINLCEIKYTMHPYTISGKYSQELLHKKTTFLQETDTRKAVHITMVTTYGLSDKSPRTAIQSEITLDDLFHLG
jgi:AAA+ ATPase superfamily predicted ATPase